MKVANDLWGQPNRVALLWEKDNVFVILMQGLTEKSQHPVTLLVGATAYQDDLIKYYSFSDVPLEQLEQHVQERFPFLKSERVRPPNSLLSD